MKICEIKDILNAANLAAWRISLTETESAELFFVKKALDTRRIKDTEKYNITVYQKGDLGGKPAVGQVNVTVSASAEKAEVEKTVRDAAFAASFALNPAFDLPEATVSEPVKKTGELATAPLAESAGKMASALFVPDTRSDAFINSAEIFVERFSTHTVTSWGTDVAFTDAKVEGEFVVQAKEPEDVEMHRQFCYGELDTAALSALVGEALTYVCDRAHAKKILKSGQYDVILVGDCVKELLSFYESRATAGMIHSGYSQWKLGDDIQGTDTVGERLTLTLAATKPFSPEGIPMKDLPMIADGKLAGIHGSTRHCRYLGVKPTGEFEKIRCENKGSLSFADMKKKPCLVAVVFSDFQCNDFSGHFGGEMRLSYLIDGDKVTPVTGGSVNGSLLDAEKNIAFSTDRYVNAAYEGPYAVRMSGISVAGTD